MKTKYLAAGFLAVCASAAAPSLAAAVNGSRPGMVAQGTGTPTPRPTISALVSFKLSGAGSPKNDVYPEYWDAGTLLMPAQQTSTSPVPGSYYLSDSPSQTITSTANLAKTSNPLSSPGLVLYTDGTNRCWYYNSQVYTKYVFGSSSVLLSNGASATSTAIIVKTQYPANTTVPAGSCPLNRATRKRP